MDCQTSTQRIPFSFEIDEDAGLLTITSNAGHDHQYQLRCLRDTYEWLRSDMNGQWVLLGSINEQHVPANGSVEAWSRNPGNPVCGFYGVTPNFRGRFASYVPSVLEKLGFVELEGLATNNRVRAR
ncbi:DUF6855 family protein [Alcanivorax sp. 1008]|uniref:DUF6855 family protein n=1 Tax=Alcanivorax sp. 1008 TaxID=2816853 RepID=UPI00351D0035